MKRLFLSSSFKDVAKLFATFANGDLKGKTIAFVPTASTPEAVAFYVEAGKRALKKLGLQVENLEISTATQVEISSKLLTIQKIIAKYNAQLGLFPMSNTQAILVVGDSITVETKTKG